MTKKEALEEEDAISRKSVRELICQNNDYYGYSDRFHEFAEKCLSLPPVQAQEWIPVTERLPEDPDPYTDELPQTVLVWEKHYSYKAEDFIEEFNIGWCWKGNWSVLGGGIVKVLAWMPLPKPYKKEGV